MAKKSKKTSKTSGKKSNRGGANKKVASAPVIQQFKSDYVEPVREWAGENVQWNTAWNWLLLGAAVGVGAAVLLDPAQGRRRLDMIRSKGADLANTGRDLAKRAKSVVQDAKPARASGATSGNRV